MFVYYYTHIDRSAVDVERRMLLLLSTLDGLASDASSRVERIRIGPGSRADRAIIGKTVEVRCGTPVRGATEVAIPIVWEATGPRALFPRLEGDLLIAPLSDGLTQIALRGSYVPPFKGAGRAIDRVVLHRLAEASVKSFVEQIAGRVEIGAEREAVAERG
jgi:hypothetical protein